MNKLNPVITSCPVCQHDLHITHLACHHCETKIEGNFSFSKFNYLSQEILYFIELFVKNRGNIKAVEKEMNVSYPTVKKHLDEAIVALGYRLDETLDFEPSSFEDTIKTDVKKMKLDILDKIKDGQLKVEEALEKLKTLKEKK